MGIDSQKKRLSLQRKFLSPIHPPPRSLASCFPPQKIQRLQEVKEASSPLLLSTPPKHIDPFLELPLYNNLSFPTLLMYKKKKLNTEVEVWIFNLQNF